MRTMENGQWMACTCAFFFFHLSCYNTLTHWFVFIECMKPVNDGNKCAFITNTIGAVGIDEDAQEKEKLRDTIETLINDNEEVIDILKGGGCFPSDVPSLAPTVTGWWWKKYYPEYY